ncbi:hypothetical protein ACTND8_09730 [Atopobiaceae bacterium HCP3S3_F7]|uniref:hypothetical protein n=1 Tax=Actinomycetota TaxID=201174 RepID=UPI003F934658
MTYTRAHRQTRAAYQHLINANIPITCWRCNKPITPNTPWDLGHTTDLARGGNPHHTQPEHATCNRSAGATNGNHDRTQPPPSRTW